MLYKDSGVDIDLGSEFVRRIKSIAESTFTTRVLTMLRGFAACYSLDYIEHRSPVLVASTDGVGTKLKMAFMVDRHDTMGIDLVAMYVNDLLVSEAQPLFFMDYISTGKLTLEKTVSIFEGIIKGCKEAGCFLIGGRPRRCPASTV